MPGWLRRYPRYRAVDVACRLDGFDDGECFLGRDLGADLGRFGKDNVGQFSQA